MTKIIYASISGSILDGQIPILYDNNFIGIDTASLNVLSSSYALTASSADDFIIRGNLTSSGSTILGDNSTDSHSINGHLNISGCGSIIMSVVGQNGELFAIDDSLVGDILNVHSIIGDPIYVVNSNGYSMLNTAKLENITSSQVLYAITSSIAYAGYFDYYIRNNNSSRAGTIYSIWNNSNVELTDTCTNDLGGTTNSVTFSMDISSSYARLICGISSGSWTLKISARLL
jgi:hypothetical protein